MTRGNWLVNYAQVEGIQRALTGMSRRATFESKMEQSVEDLKRDYLDYEMEFRAFFPELKAFSESKRQAQQL
jgi:acyl carrier protein phosphodiesterase